MAVKTGWQGRFFEDFEVGDIYRCRLGRTVTEADNIWFTLLTNNTNQIHFNNDYGKKTEFGKCLINSTLTLAIVTGMGVADISENGFALVGGRIQKFKVPKEDGPIKAEPLAFTAELNLDGAAERSYMFDHVWRQTQAKLYTADMGGVDWAYYRQVYERQLPYVSNDADFAELRGYCERVAGAVGLACLPDDRCRAHYLAARRRENQDACDRSSAQPPATGSHRIGG